MPQHHNLAPVACGHPSPPEKYPDQVLADAVSATTVSFVACGAAVAGLGELLRDLRLALQVAEPRAASPERQRAAALLPARLESARWALDGATAAIGALLEDTVPSGKSNIQGVIEK